jgi:hypothetical protein
VCPELMQSKPPPDYIHAMADIDNASEVSEALSVIILAQAENLSDCQPINPDFVLLDSQSMVHLFSNLKHIQNICPAQLPIKVHYNKGTLSTAEVADFGDTQVYVNKDSIANVLSLFHVGQKHWITYDSHNRKGVFHVHTPREVVEFYPTPNGLRIVDLKQNPEAAYLLINDANIDDDLPSPASSPVHQLHINTVSQNFEGYTKNKYNKLRALIASWAWLPVPPNTISKPCYVSICSKTAVSQRLTFATLITSVALTWHQSEARWSGGSLREWSLITLKFRDNFCQFMGTSPWL